MNNAIEKINNERQTVKAYADKRIPSQDWEQVLDAIKWSPSSFGVEPYRVIVVNHENQKLREEMKAVMWGQGVVTEADKMVIFVAYGKEIMLKNDWAVKRKIREAEIVRNMQGKEAEERGRKGAEAMLTHLKNNEPDLGAWAAKQTYIALGISMAAATLLNIGSTPMEGFDHAALDAVLRKHKLLREGEKVAVVAAFGYPKDKTSYSHWGSGRRVRDKNSEKFTVV